MTVQTHVGGQSLQLRPERAVFWPAQTAVLVADVHLGKDQVFRRQGLAVPAGVLSADLLRLSTLIEKTRAERLIVLGDWVHAPPRPEDPWPDEIKRWRQRHSSLSLELVQGNHDRSLAPWLADWQMTNHRDRLVLAELVLVHEWHQRLSEPGISGHLHPGVVIRAGHDRLRLPAFLQGGEHLVMPAFGRFTGLMDCTDFPTEKSWAITDKKVMALPPARKRA
jgi:DNA ligase-associated metallophosphoesterase